MTAAAEERGGACEPRSLPSAPQGPAAPAARPSFVVYSLADAVAALAAAVAAGTDVHLRVPLAFAASLGPDAAREMIAGAASAAGAADGISWTIDCGDDPGLALAAVRAGAPSLYLDASEDVRERISDIARQRGARLDVRATEPLLDLADAVEPLSACRAWLADGVRRPSGTADARCHAQVGGVSENGL